MDKREGLDALGQYHPVEHDRAARRILEDMAQVEEAAKLLDLHIDPYDGGCPADIETVVPKLPQPDICIFFEGRGVRWTMKNATGVAPDLDLAMRDIHQVIVGPG